MAQNGQVDKTKIGTTILLVVSLILGSAGFLKPSTMPSQDEIYQVLQTQIGSSISSLAKLCTQYVAQIDTYACWARGNDSKLMDYNTNSTYITSEAIGNTTSGTVFLQDIAFNYSLTIPQHVSVTDSINGSQRTYGNVLDSTGSPYTISVDSRVSGYYMAQDASLKYVNSWSSTNASAVINNAFGNLTTGRTWQETVYLKGNFTITSILYVPSYTHLILDGELYAANGLDSMILTNTHGITHSAVDSFITVEGGSWYGNSANQVNIGMDLSLIYMRGATDSTIKNIYFYDSPEFATALNGGNNRTGISYCNFQHCGQAVTKGPIYLSTVGNDYQEYNYVDHCNLNDSGQNGIYCGDESLYGTISYNTVTNFCRLAYGGGISVRGNGTIVSHNHVYFNSNFTAGAFGIGSPSGVAPANVTVDNNYIFNMTQNGIRAQGNYWTITKNHIEKTQAGYAGILLYSSSYDTVGYNTVTDCSGTGCNALQFYSSSWDTISNNIFSNDKQGIDAYGTSTNDTVTSNQILGVTEGISIDASTVNGWTIADNTITGASLILDLAAGSLNWTSIKTNAGWNPVGYIANPVSNQYLRDTGGSSAIANNTLYTNNQSPKDIYIMGGAFNGASYNCTVNANVIFSNAATGPTMMIHLEPGMTILFGWSSAPTIVVFGE